MSVAGDEAGPRRDAAGELLQSEERFRLLIDSVVDYAIFILDADGTIVSWNAGAERLKGYTEPEIIGRSSSVFYPPEAREAGEPGEFLAEAVAQGRAARTGWRVRKDGSRFWADVVVTALFDADGRHTGFAKVTRDTTETHLAAEATSRALEEQQQAVLRLKELESWRTRFIGSVAHDLQTPVIAVDGFASLLELDLADQDQLELVQRIRSNVRSLQELIDNLRTATFFDQDRIGLDLQDVALEPMIRRIVDDMAPVLGNRSVELQVQDIELSADPHALERILRNLLGNVARHTPEDVEVFVRTRRRGDKVVVEVEDCGHGIPAELLPSIFDRYSSGSTGGTGLGLAIAHRYVELHGGTITARSQPGQGAVFRVTLPVAP